MPNRSHPLRAWVSALGFAGALVLATPAHALELVTEQEAALPPDRLPPLETRGGTTRRPTITIVSPPPNGGVVKSPLSLKVKLQAFGGAKIDPESVVVSYKKTPMVNLTPRLAPYITADGIEVPDAQVPPGTHQFRIEVKDKDGRVAGTDFSVQVVK
jgi:hypothetical protein